MITKDMLIADALKMGDTEKLAEVLSGFGMHCLMCMLAHGETIEQAASAHQIDVDVILDALNKALEEK